MTDKLRFDIAPQEVVVEIGGEDYTLREASGDTVCRYKNMVLEATKIGADGKPVGFHNLADTDPFLVSRCLYDSEDKLVPLKTIMNWPYYIQKALASKAKEISRGFKEEEGDENEGDDANLKK